MELLPEEISIEKSSIVPADTTTSLPPPSVMVFVLVEESSTSEKVMVSLPSPEVRGATETSGEGVVTGTKIDAGSNKQFVIVVTTRCIEDFVVALACSNGGVSSAS